MMFALTTLQWGCKKKDVFPSQTLPEITSLSPSSAMGGTLIIIKGNHLKDVNSVKFGASDAAGFDQSANSDTSIRVTVPDSLPLGPTYVQVYLPDGKGYAAHSFTVLLTPPVPKIDSVSPTTAFPGDEVTIFGTNFTDVTGVKVGGVDASFAHTLDTNGKLTAVIPLNASGGSQFITVINANGYDSIAFNVNFAPVIKSFEPAIGAVGDSITIHGLRFLNITAVQLTSVDVGYVVVNDSTIHFAVPNGGQSGKITVTNSLGTATSPNNFTVQGSVAEWFIFDDALAANWWKGGTAPAAGWDNVSVFDNTTPLKSGTYSISVNYTNGYGGFQVGNGGAAIDLSQYSVVKLSIYGGTGTGGKKVKLVIDGDYNDGQELILTEGSWTDYTVPLALLGNPATLTEFVLQEYSGNAPSTIYLDNIGIQ